MSATIFFFCASPLLALSQTVVCISWFFHVRPWNPCRCNSSTHPASRLSFSSETGLRKGSCWTVLRHDRRRHHGRTYSTLCLRVPFVRRSPRQQPSLQTHATTARCHATIHSGDTGGLHFRSSSQLGVGLARAHHSGSALQSTVLLRRSSSLPTQQGLNKGDNNAVLTAAVLLDSQQSIQTVSICSGHCRNYSRNTHTTTRHCVSSGTRP